MFSMQNPYTVCSYVITIFLLTGYRHCESCLCIMHNANQLDYIGELNHDSCQRDIRMYVNHAIQ